MAVISDSPYKVSSLYKNSFKVLKIKKYLKLDKLSSFQANWKPKLLSNKNCMKEMLVCCKYQCVVKLSFYFSKGPSIFCPICDKEGHLKKDCPDDRIPEIVALPPLDKQYVSVLTGVIRQVPSKFAAHLYFLLPDFPVLKGKERGNLILFTMACLYW